MSIYWGGRRQAARSCTFGMSFCGKQQTIDESANIIQIGYETRDGVPVPVIAQANQGPPCLCAVRHFECVQHKAIIIALRYVDDTTSVLHACHIATDLAEAPFAIHTPTLK